MLRLLFSSFCGTCSVIGIGAEYPCDAYPGVPLVHHRVDVENGVHRHQFKGQPEVPHCKIPPQGPPGKGDEKGALKGEKSGFELIRGGSRSIWKNIIKFLQK